MFRTLINVTLIFAVLTLITCWVAVILVDGFNIMQLGDRLIERSNQDRSLFVLLFGEARFIEWAQWFCLMVAGLTAVYISALELTRGNEHQQAFFLLIGILLLVMLIEDAGNLRHAARDIWMSLDYHPGISRYFTFVFYGLLAVIPIWALFFHGRYFIRPETISYLFALAFAFYFLAAVFSATATFGWWYTHAGEMLNSALFDGRVIYTSLNLAPGYWIMDLLIEETLELIGAICFLLFCDRYYAKLISEPMQTLIKS